MSISTSAKVVIQLPDGPLKGFVTEEDLTMYQASAFEPGEIKLVGAETGELQTVSIDGAKGIFFVKDFEGKADQPDIRFHDDARPAGYLWVRMKFIDGEVLEGMIDNSSEFILSRGVWVTPTDPTSNNWLIYALKRHLKEFEILGMRQTLHRRTA